MTTSSPSLTPVQMCTRCVMDTSDPDIRFDDAGVCHYCRYYETTVANRRYRPDAEGRRQLETLVAEMKAWGRGKDYDAIIGLSGGVDSSYLAWLMVKVFDLRLLAVHVDAGWNSELAVKNIEQIVKSLDIDLYTHVVDWEEVKDLQVAYLCASVANQDVPQDHAFFAKLYAVAAEKNIRYVLSGINYATESILPRGWGYSAMDAKQLKAIHRRFGKRPLRSYPTIGFFEYYVVNHFIRRMKVLSPLNFVPYDRDQAIQTLEREVGFRYYGGKHYESRFTKFFQGYYLPRKFGYDKRRAHLASLIVSGQMTREQALAELEKPSYPPQELAEDLGFISKKLNLGEGELESLIALPNKSFRDYPNQSRLFAFKDRLMAAWRSDQT